MVLIQQMELAWFHLGRWLCNLLYEGLYRFDRAVEVATPQWAVWSAQRLIWATVDLLLADGLLYSAAVFSIFLHFKSAFWVLHIFVVEKLPFLRPISLQIFGTLNVI